jgi:hypothetical protein
MVWPINTFRQGVGRRQEIMSRTALAVVLIALAGAALRGVAAWATFPWSGDPTFSYCYRALLIYHGETAGVFLMWHYPGYPCLIAALMWLSGGLLSPYAAGLLLSAGSSVGLIFVIDGLVKPHVQLPSTRVVIASFLALYETLVVFSAGPLTEPVYLILTYGALALIYPPRLSSVRAFLAGLLLGLACSVRSEGLAPSVGLLAVVALTEARRTPDGSWWRSLRLVSLAAAGILLTFGWVLLNPEFMVYASQTQQDSFTVPPAQGLKANAARAVECVYHACIVWLPMVLLLPYWILLSVGLFGSLDSPAKRRLTFLLLAVILPSLAGVTLTIMHKRTGSFLLPAAAVWLGFGCEFLLLRTPLGTARARRALVVALVLLLNVGQAGRLLRSLRAIHLEDGPPTYVQGRLLKQAKAPAGKVWAFGGEPEVYQAWDQPIVFPFRKRPMGEQWLYRDCEGSPDAFVQRLRDWQYDYLTFAVAKDSSTTQTGYEDQPYGGYASQPRRSDLRRFIESDSAHGLELLGKAPASGGQAEVFVYRIRPISPAR